MVQTNSCYLPTPIMTVVVLIVSGPIIINNINFNNIIESTLNRVCATHTVRSYFPNLLHRRQIRHPVDRTVPDNFDFRMAVFYGRTVHAILAVSYSLQNGSMPSRPAHVHDSPG